MIENGKHRKKGAGGPGALVDALRPKGFGWLLALSVLFAFAATTGWLYHDAPESLTVLGLFKQHAVGAVCMFAAVSALMYAALCLAFWLVDSVAASSCSPRAIKGSGENGSVFRWSAWAKYAGVVALCWLPYVVVLHPAVSRGFDYFWQLLQGLGVFPLSSHHPVFSSYVFGWLFSAGYALGGASMGFFLTTLVQFACMVFVLGFCFACLRGMGVDRRVLAVLCAAVCLCPVFPTHALWLIKDSLFTSLCVLLFFLAYLHVWYGVQRVRRPWYASAPAIALTALLFSLFRNGVVAIAAVLLVVLFVVELARVRNTKEKPPAGEASQSLQLSHFLQQWGVAAVIFLVLLAGWNVHLQVQNVYPTNVRESITFPLRQVLRTVQLNPQDLSPEERAILERVYADKVAEGESVESVIGQLDWFSGDKTKASYIDDTQTLFDFMGVWAGMGLRHPGCYLDAALRGTNNYWWFDVHPDVLLYAVELDGLESDFANEKRATRLFDEYQDYVVRSLEHAGVRTNQSVESMYADHPMLGGIMHATSTFPEVRKTFKKAIAHIEQLPLVSWFFIPAFYFWLMLATFCYLFSRKKPGRCCWPILLLWALAFLSPINGYTRYVVGPEMFAMILVGICLMPQVKSNFMGDVGAVR